MTTHRKNEKPSGTFLCLACGREQDGSTLYPDPQSTREIWTCSNLQCGGVRVFLRSTQADRPEDTGETADAPAITQFQRLSLDSASLVQFVTLKYARLAKDGETIYALAERMLREEHDRAKKAENELDELTQLWESYDEINEQFE